MGEVLRALEGPIAPMVCASEDPTHAGICGRTGYCNVNHLWLTVQRAIAARSTRSPSPTSPTPRAQPPVSLDADSTDTELPNTTEL